MRIVQSRLIGSGFFYTKHLTTMVIRTIIQKTANAEYVISKRKEDKL